MQDHRPDILLVTLLPTHPCLILYVWKGLILPLNRILCLLICIVYLSDHSSYLEDNSEFCSWPTPATAKKLKHSRTLPWLHRRWCEVPTFLSEEFCQLLLIFLLILLTIKDNFFTKTMQFPFFFMSIINISTGKEKYLSCQCNQLEYSDKRINFFSSF